MGRYLDDGTIERIVSGVTRAFWHKMMQLERTAAENPEWEKVEPDLDRHPPLVSHLVCQLLLKIPDRIIMVISLINDIDPHRWFAPAEGTFLQVRSASR